ncbi:MAG: hypothetical protein ACYC6X_00375 [Minisyncoccota bacterium]
MNTLKYFLLTSIAAFFLLGSFGLTHLTMNTGAEGQMSGCPLMGIPALCHMSPLEHAFTFQNMLTAIPFSGIFAFLISILLALSIVLLAPVLLSIATDLFEPLIGPPTRTNRLIPRHSFQEAFSNGIIHSKAF